MPLTGSEISRLATVIYQEWDHNGLELFARDYLDVHLANLAAPSLDLKERAARLINSLNTELPPRDRELLEKLRSHGNAALQRIANELLIPPYFSPTGDAHDAIVLGRAAFVDRTELRDSLRAFTHPQPHTTRLLIIRGQDASGGKSYSWELLRHLAVVTVGAIPQRLRLRGTSYTPRQLVEQVFRLLRLDLAELPTLVDEPQLAKIDPLIAAFQGQMMELPKPYWLVIDDVNEQVEPAVAETIYALAYTVEQMKPPHLWLALLGYNKPITDNELRFRAEDDATFPDARLLGAHFQAMAAAGGHQLAAEKARTYAELLLSRYPTLTKEAMNELTPLIEDMGEKLRAGLQP